MKIPVLLLACITASGSSAKTKALLISPPSLKDAWSEYAKLRGQSGVVVKVVTTDEIQKKYQTGDLQNRMRLCAREHIDQHGVTAVILGGDSSPDGGLVPDRDTFHKNMWGNDVDIPSDLYFISPTSWDHDKDGIYGEFEEDRDAITYPDGSVGIGRIPIRTKEDIKAYTEKVRSYLAMKSTPALGMTCEVRGAYAKVLKSGRKWIPEAWPDGNVSFFFNDFTAWDGEGAKGSYQLNPKNLGDQFNEGKISKWHLHGHGLIDRWVLEGRTKFSYSNIKALKNEKTPLVITTVSCFTGHFDAEQDPCVTEAMLRQPKGGAVLIVAPCREGKPHFHDPRRDFQLMTREGKLDGTTQTMTSFWVASLGKDKAPAGRALALPKAGLSDDAKKSATYHQGICELNLLGDPTLPVR